MALEVGRAPRGVQIVGETVIVDRHLYLTEDRSRVVEENDPAMRWLWASPGQQVPRADAERLGLLPRTAEPEPEVVAMDIAEQEPADADEAADPEAQAEPDPEVKAEPKRRTPAANKARSRAADK